MGTTISCRFSAPTLLLLMLVATPGRVPFAASAPQQTQQPASPPIAPVPQVAPKPKPKAPQKPAPAPPKFPSAVKWSVIVDAAPVAPPLVAEGRVILALRSGTLSARLLTDGTEAWTVKLAVDQPLAADGRQDLRRRRRDAARTERRRRFERMESGSREADCADSRARRLGHRRRWRIRDCPARRRWRNDLEQERLEQSPSAPRSTATASTCRSRRAG